MTFNRESFERLEDQQIAAFIDGAMDPRSRDSVAGRIAEDPEARQLLVEVTLFLEEAGTLGLEERPLPPPGAASHQLIPRRHWLTVWGGVLAACLALAVTRPSGMSPLDVDWYQILSTDSDSSSLVPHRTQSDVNVFAFFGSDSPEAQSFRAGVADFDLEISMRVPTMSHEASASDHLHYSFGRWVEASRIASAKGRLAFFQAARYQAALQEARIRIPLQEARAEMDRVTTALQATPPDLPTVERAFDQIALLY